MQFKLKGGNGGYIGLQPQTAGGIRAIFSVFGDGTENLMTEQCKGGADGGHGVSCSKLLEPMKFDTTYYLTVVQDKKDAHIWRGYVSTNKQETIKDSGLIGVWKARPASGAITSGNAGFVENFTATHSLDDLTGFKAEFQPPYTDNQANARGKIEKVFLNGRWKGVSAPYLKSTPTAKGGYMVDFNPPPVKTPAVVDPTGDDEKDVTYQHDD